MSSPIIDRQQLPTPSKMACHPAILSVYEVCLRTIPDFPQIINGLETTRGIGENVAITREHVEYARKVVTAVRGYFASSSCNSDQKHEAVFIAEMYQVALESTYSKTTFFYDCDPVPVCQNAMIKELKDRIQRLECRIARICLTEERVAKAQASADNAQIVSRNSRLQYPDPYFPLKKTVRFFFSLILCLSASYLEQKVSGSGFRLAEEVCPRNVNVNALASRIAHPIGSLPLNFNGQIPMYSDEQILTMIIFYNENFGIGPADSLPVRIAKFTSYLSDFAEK
ncbi:hypothetical protein IW262DRAFT_1553180 [Armillaria fumosa]|nr:hypothetical protein IW262DRAFT_1553180 [Armillaria fumosa]